MASNAQKTAFGALAVGIVALLLLSRKEQSFDLSPGHQVLAVDFGAGSDNVFHYTVPGLGSRSSLLTTATPTNVLWVLFERPRDSNGPLQIVFTNVQGNRLVITQSLRLPSEGFDLAATSKVIIVQPFIIPNRYTIKDEVICYEAAESGYPLFKIRLP